jgi:hypothetical protein
MDPAWSPDGTKLVYEGQNDQIVVVNADGTGATPIVSGLNRTPDWQPIPPGYVRPAGATPVRISLVPAHEQCTSPNRAHGTPLAFGSCGPQQTSDWLTVGSEANGNSPRSSGSLKARAVPGNPATQTDEADVALRLSLTDVRNASDETDYAGELRASLTLRLTDRDNTPFASTPGTMVDHVLTLDAPCTPTGGAAGSTCSIQTTADSLVPSTVKEGRRMVMELGQAQVFDGGPDGDTATAGNTLFAVGGLFVP